MRLACPHCAAAYEVPPTLLGGRRRLRCARCGQDWAAPGESLGTAEKVETQPGAAREAAEPHGQARPAVASVARRPAWDATMALRLAWAASLLALAIGAWEAVAWRSGVMRAWPPSQRLYSTLGLGRQNTPDRTDTRPLRHAREQTAAPERGGG